MKDAATTVEFDPYAPPTNRVTRTVHHEAYFNLYGLSMGWIEAINNALHDYTQPATDEGESYVCEACMAFRFMSTDKTRVEEAERIFGRLLNLARKTEHRASYHLMIG